MSYNAAKTAKSFAATMVLKPPAKQYQAFVEALAKLLVEAHNEGYRKGHAAGEYDDTGSKP